MSSQCKMASFDIKSLFTNIPLHETIDICCNSLFETDSLVFGFNKTSFHKLLSFAVTNCIFLFNGKYFKQTDGVAMGNPLGPTLANAFLVFHESKWLNECPENFKPLLYRRYIDDTFLVFKSEAHIPLFLDYLNSRHVNIKFTCEVESNNKLPFLDIEVERRGSTFSTSIYRKPTFTGLTTKFNSNIPDYFKNNLIRTLVTRAFYICSSYTNMHNELEKLKNILYCNGFPRNFTESVIGRQLNKLIVPPKLVPTVNKASVMFVIPFLGSKSFSIRNKLSFLLRQCYPQVSLRIIFRPANKISTCFKIKDRIPDVLRSSVIYQYSCGSCNASYIGQTKRHLAARIAEHQGVSVRTNKPVSKPSFFSVRDHSRQNRHNINSDHFRILHTATRTTDRLICESLLSHKLKPTLGLHDSSIPLLCF